MANNVTPLLLPRQYRSTRSCVSTRTDIGVT